MRNHLDNRWPVLGRDSRLPGRLLIPVQVKLVIEQDLRKALPRYA
jgi:hypothetical protein